VTGPPSRRSGVRRASSALLLLFGLACAGLLAAPVSAETTLGEGWVTSQGEELAVLHRDGDALYAARVLEIFESEAGGIAASMGLTTLSPIRAVIASSDEEFAELTHYGAPDWGVGCALVQSGLVVLKSPRIVDYPLQMESVVEHELAHIAAGRVLRGIHAPRWFDEGVAQAIAGEWRLAQVGALAAAAESGTLPPLSALEGAFPASAQSASFAYAMSFQAVRLMMKEAGVRTPGELVSAVAAAGDFDDAVASLTGLGPGEFERAFAAFLSRRFTWGTLLNDGRALFTLAAVLFGVAVIVRIRRSRARMRQWAEEEERENVTTDRRRGAGDSRWH
jgi:hypothetical protein